MVVLLALLQGYLESSCWTFWGHVSAQLIVGAVISLSCSTNVLRKALHLQKGYCGFQKKKKNGLLVKILSLRKQSQ